MRGAVGRSGSPTTWKWLERAKRHPRVEMTGCSNPRYAGSQRTMPDPDLNIDQYLTPSAPEPPPVESIPAPTESPYASAVRQVLDAKYVVLLASVVGYGVWALLMGRYPSSQIAPWSMLVPVVGVLSSWAAFGERPALAEVFGGLLVVGGILYSSRRP